MNTLPRSRCNCAPRTQSAIIYERDSKFNTYLQPSRRLARPFSASISRRSPRVRGTAVAAGFSLGSLFGGARRSKPADPLRKAADSIRERLADGDVTQGELDGYVDVLLAAQIPFREQQIGGGPWQVVYTRGALLWQGWSSPGKLVRVKNSASQEFEPAGRTALNRADVFGSNLYVTAGGTYEPQGNATTTPVRIKANIKGGTLHAFGREIPLGFIRGEGFFEVIYIDDSLRLFRNTGGPGDGIAVQIKRDVLDGLLAS